MHLFYIIAGAVWLGLVLIRSAVWRYRPLARCQRCSAEGKVHNQIRGTWKREIICMAVFVPIGLFVHVLMGLYLSYFLTRWFVIRKCAECGSEALVYGKAPIESQRV